MRVRYLQAFCTSLDAHTHLPISRNLKHQTQHPTPEPQTQNSKPQTPNPKPRIPETLFLFRALQHRHPASPNPDPVCPNRAHGGTREPCLHKASAVCRVATFLNPEPQNANPEARQERGLSAPHLCRVPRFLRLVDPRDAFPQSEIGLLRSSVALASPTPYTLHPTPYIRHPTP